MEKEKSRAHQAYRGTLLCRYVRANGGKNGRSYIFDDADDSEMKIKQMAKNFGRNTDAAAGSQTRGHTSVRK